MSESDWKKIKDDRVECDPFYKLLIDTNGVFKDKKNVKFIDELLKTGIDIIYKKYGKTIQDNNHIAVIFKLLLSNRYGDQDEMMKLFALLAMISHEPELANAVESFYNTKGGIFEEKGPSMFRTTMILVKENINRTFNFAYNEANIVETISNFIHSIHMKYTCG